MTTDLFKCVGGSMHGKRVRCWGSQLEVPVWPKAQAVYSPTYIPDDPTFRTERYEKHSVGFGSHTSITVLRLSTMGDDEFWRRIADLVEL